MKLIQETNQLKHVINEFCQSEFVTVDTEFMRESTFWPQLCLIQLASPQKAVIIDPLSQKMDLTTFFKLMSDHSVVKVFHAARQDLEIIYHLAKIIPQPLFDTQIAGSVCGYGESISYDQLVERITGQYLDKSSRFTDWSHRPLSDKQLEYALADVTYLRDIYLALKLQLEKSGRLAWVEEEISTLQNPALYDLPVEDAWKRIKGRIRKPRELAVLQKVATWRELEARERNVPRGRILKDDSLIEIATQQPKDETALRKLRSVAKGFERSSSAINLIQAVKEGLLVNADDLPTIVKHAPLSDSTGAAIDLLRVLLKIVADENNIAPKMIATTDDLEKIAKRQDKINISAMQGWRYQMFGQKAEDMMEGRLGFYFSKEKIATKVLTPQNTQSR